MADRKQTPDILSELMAGSSEKKPASQQTSKPAKRQASKPSEKKPAPPPAEQEKTKATFYLSPGGIEALESSWMKLRSLAGSHRGQVSKSALVEVALQRLEKAMKKEAEDILRSVLR